MTEQDTERRCPFSAISKFRLKRPLLESVPAAVCVPYRCIKVRTGTGRTIEVRGAVLDPCHTLHGSVPAPQRTDRIRQPDLPAANSVSFQYGPFATFPASRSFTSQDLPVTSTRACAASGSSCYDISAGTEVLVMRRCVMTYPFGIGIGTECRDRSIPRTPMSWGRNLLGLNVLGTKLSGIEYGMTSSYDFLTPTRRQHAKTPTGTVDKGDDVMTMVKYSEMPAPSNTEAKAKMTISA